MLGDVRGLYWGGYLKEFAAWARVVQMSKAQRILLAKREMEKYASSVIYFREKNVKTQWVSSKKSLQNRSNNARPSQ